MTPSRTVFQGFGGQMPTLLRHARGQLLLHELPIARTKILFWHVLIVYGAAM
jgi:hypothetical protein